VVDGEGEHAGSEVEEQRGGVRVVAAAVVEKRATIASSPRGRLYTCTSKYNALSTHMFHKHRSLHFQATLRALSRADASGINAKIPLELFYKNKSEERGFPCI
jgi:hypothetical protein